VGRDGQLRHFSTAVRRFGHSVAAAGAAGAGFGCSAHSRTAMRLRKRSARPRSYWGPSPIDQHANRGDRLVARTHSGSPGPCAYSRSRYGAGGARNVPVSPLPRSPSRQVQPLGAPLRAARARARRSARSGWAPQYDSIASRGVGGTNGRSSARDRTLDGKMVGSALLRRASDCRFLSAFSSRQPDIGPPPARWHHAIENLKYLLSIRLSTAVETSRHPNIGRVGRGQ
jgi:hypothetical protein